MQILQDKQRLSALKKIQIEILYVSFLYYKNEDKVAKTEMNFEQQMKGTKLYKFLDTGKMLKDITFTLCTHSSGRKQRDDNKHCMHERNQWSKMQ